MPRTRNDKSLALARLFEVVLAGRCPRSSETWQSDSYRITDGPVPIGFSYTDDRSLVRTEFSGELSWLISEVMETLCAEASIKERMKLSERLAFRAISFIEADGSDGEDGRKLLLSVLDEAKSYLGELGDQGSEDVLRHVGALVLRAHGVATRDSWRKGSSVRAST